MLVKAPHGCRESSSSYQYNSPPGKIRVLPVISPSFATWVPQSLDVFISTLKEQVPASSAKSSVSWLQGCLNLVAGAVSMP